MHLRVGLAGLGTVAQGVLTLLSEQADVISARAGRRIEVVRVASRTRREEAVLGDAQFSHDLASLTDPSEVDVVVELIGGETSASELVQSALGAGQSVVTANKALIATQGQHLAELASNNGAALRFEAAVAGGIPVVGALRTGLAANRISRIAGIINGTSNYILSAMANDSADFASVLAEAQRLGYAEADPTFDVEGIDAAHKLAILSHLAFDIPTAFDAVYCEGISQITLDDIAYAAELGYVIKHLGIARQDDAGVEMRVHPTLLPKKALLAKVDGVMNAVMVDGHASGPTLYYGAGAGGAATASAVVADLIELARHSEPAPTVPTVAKSLRSIDDAVSACYLRVDCLDRPGVMAKLASVLSAADISIESIIQHEAEVRRRGEDSWVPVVITTSAVSEARMNAAIASLAQLPEVHGDVTRIRIEGLA
ncbi:MAG: homoserine dehydrogenase [Pseudomonadaceae bacterium]|nr:homoserine dehydrogenase [Pseudomonadaceae bacterium]